MANRATRSGLMTKPAQRVWSQTLVGCMVSEERRQWILENYPPEKTGRPGILNTSSRKQYSPKPRRDPTRYGGMAVLDMEEAEPSHEESPENETDRDELAEAA